MSETEKPPAKRPIPGAELDQAAADLLRAAAGKPAEEVGRLVGDLVGIVGDNVSSFRWTNRIQILGRTKEKLEAAGIALEDVRELPMRELDAVLQNGANVDEPELQEMWAGLLATALDPSFSTSADRSYTAVLSQLTGRDALALKLLHDLSLDEHQRMFEGHRMRAERRRQQREAQANGRPVDDPCKESESDRMAQLRARAASWRERIEREKLSDKSDVKPTIFNLHRLGLIERADASPAPAVDLHLSGSPDQKFDNVAAGVRELQELHAQSIADRRDLGEEQGLVFLSETNAGKNYNLTNFGRALMKACGVDNDLGNKGIGR